MRKFISIMAAFFLVTALAACGTGEEPPAETVTLKVGATATPHAELLEHVRPDLLAEGIELAITVFEDYNMPNTAVENGELDANYFQHLPHMAEFNVNNGTHLKEVAAIHYEPFGIYPGKDKTITIETIPENAVISVPNDISNEARALLLLQEAGLITLPEGADLTVTKEDILSNPKNIELYEIEAAQLIRSLPDVDASVINGNYALSGGLSVASDAIAFEDDKDSVAAVQYANYIVVKEGNENGETVQKLVRALQSDKVRTYIEENYNGGVIPAF